ncbi:serine/threonine-protein kinase [Streptomyces spororaveus]|uniref:serine/threonine-protein kinase n=1 Tax=Streptomyces spororaveus TaxID=284039 RepID=UPI0036A3B299
MYELNHETDPAVLGPFELLAVLGQGGMGRTYLARKLNLVNLAPEQETAYHLTVTDGEAEPVLAAVKVIKPSKLRDSTENSEQEARARFAQEVQTMRTVASARVPALIAADPQATQPWLAMDYVHGPTLHKVVHSCGPLEVGPYAALGLALVDALRAIHEVKLLHRDLKPGNIALGPGGPVVLDFGLAVLTERDGGAALTKTGARFGTVSYMSPEQTQDAKHVEAPSDIFALGAVLFFAAADRSPYPYGPTGLAPSWEGVPPDYRPLLARLLALVPTQRPTLTEIESELIQLLAVHGRTVEAAAEELRTLVAGSGLIPELPDRARGNEADPELQQAAQQAVDEGADPDSPWADHEPDLFDEFLDEEIADIELPAEEPLPATPADYVPTVLDPQAHPLPGPAPAPGHPDSVTSYPLAPPQPTPPHAPGNAGPSVPPAAAKAAERLRKAYAHSGRL